MGMKGNSGRRPCWDVTIEFQAKDLPEPTRIEMRIFVGSQMPTWGDWQSFLHWMTWKWVNPFPCITQRNGQL